MLRLSRLEGINYINAVIVGFISTIPEQMHLLCIFSNCDVCMKAFVRLHQIFLYGKVEADLFVLLIQSVGIDID